MNRRPTSVRLNACLLTASLILLAANLAANLAAGHVRGAIYATVAVIAFGSLLAVGIRENRANRPQVPRGDHRPPLWRRVLAGLLGVRLDRDKH